MIDHPDHYTVFGNPIAHSKSPQIHAAFAQETEQKLAYDKTFVELGEFANTVDAFRKNGGKGANVTLPFKHDALAYANDASERAQLAGAANTLVFDGAHCHADNTDGVGLVRDLQDNLDLSLTGKRILILGAGGAVRGVMIPLFAEQPKQIVIANRTVSKAEELANVFAGYGAISASGYADLSGCFDLIINGTAASLQGEVPPISPALLHKETFCYDLAFGDKPTAFLDWAEQNGCQNRSDGMGMLVEQAAESFYLWRGVRPSTTKVIEALKCKP